MTSLPVPLSPVMSTVTSLGAMRSTVRTTCCMALLRKIPKAGMDAWPADNRLRWFRTFAMNVSQVYDADDDPVELEIKLKADQKAGA